MLKNKRIIAAVTGSAAAYKSIELVRDLKKLEASVRVVMTPDATKFVTPLALQIASENEVISDMFARPMSHIELPRWGDAMIVAPLTANTVSKFYSASAGDMVSACFLAFPGPVVVAPAMNWRMYTDRIFQERLAYLKDRGIREVAPESGKLACGEEGTGRMASSERIILEALRAVTAQDLSGKRIVITAGPTREYIDPVRFISNRSSGKMGYSLARCAYARGAEVTLVSGPVHRCTEANFRELRVETAEEMRNAVMEELGGADALVMAAAVADFAPRGRAGTKVEKEALTALELVRTPDIISEAAKSPRRPLIVGFSAETGDRRARAAEKLSRKGMDLVVFNDVSAADAGFDCDTNRVVLIDRTSEEELPLMSKDEVAVRVLDRIARMIP